MSRRTWSSNRFERSIFLRRANAWRARMLQGQISKSLRRITFILRQIHDLARLSSLRRFGRRRKSRESRSDVQSHRLFFVPGRALSSSLLPISMIISRWLGAMADVISDPLGFADQDESKWSSSRGCQWRSALIERNRPSRYVSRGLASPEQFSRRCRRK